MQKERLLTQNQFSLIALRCAYLDGSDKSMLKIYRKGWDHYDVFCLSVTVVSTRVLRAYRTSIRFKGQPMIAWLTSGVQRVYFRSWVGVSGVSLWYIWIWNLVNSRMIHCSFCRKNRLTLLALTTFSISLDGWCKKSKKKLHKEKAEEIHWQNKTRD